MTAALTYQPEPGEATPSPPKGGTGTSPPDRVRIYTSAELLAIAQRQAEVYACRSGCANGFAVLAQRALDRGDVEEARRLVREIVLATDPDGRGS